MTNRSNLGRIAMILVPTIVLVAVLGAGGAQTDQNADVFSPLYQLYQYIRDYYYEPERITDDEALYGAMMGIVEQLEDPYSQFLDPEAYQRYENAIAGEYIGIGLKMSILDGVLTVIAPLASSPAEEADVLTGDQILAIDGRSTDGMSLAWAKACVLCEIGTEIVLTMRRDGGEIVDVGLVCESFNVPAVEWSFMDNNRIGYVRVYRFGSDTTRELNQALRALDLKSLDGLILDLRDNPGGRGLEAISVASCFVDDGFVVSTADQLRAPRKQYSFGNALPNLPLAVLINRGTASASEITAGAIRDRDMGILIGETSFGKGIYQRLFKFPDGSALKLTAGRWFTPEGHSVDGIGLEPDIAVEKDENAIEIAIQWLNEHAGLRMPIDLDAECPRAGTTTAP